MGMGRVAWLAAVMAFVARFPGLLWPLRPDEAGFLLVARAWQPEADSVYGRYFVDRPPPIIWLMQATDAVGGAYTHRLVGAVGCSVLVLASAAAARELARRAGLVDPAAVRRVTAWVAVGTAALVSNAQIDPVAAKGELFGIPLVMASCWLSLRAVRRISAGDAFWAGFLAMLAVGLKQSIVGGLVFGGVLLLGSVLARQLPVSATVRCALAALAGAAVPVVAVVAWALAVGVRLETLWYTTVSFRSDANRIIATQSSEGATSRVWVLLLVFVGVGMLLLVVLFLAQLVGLLRLDAVPVVATLVMLGVDLAGVAVSGSYWMPYLFVPIPPLALALALLLSNDRVRGTRDKVNPAAIAFVVASSVVALVGWTGAWVGGRVPVEVRTGEALDAIAQPGDQVLVYGGRADIQWATHAGSPYPYLWSLPMRTLDPGLEDLRATLTGNNPPTWFVEASYINTWSELGTRPIESSLIRKYEFVVTACDRYRIYHLNSVDPVKVDVDCTTPYRTIWGQ
ncbi:hypothetical protein [Nocardioides baculatus]|uniref:Glycosyltransferase RgtA/B/C/D-like domain-containing protein n=1 Tax=Nocardioides baculatus TaxID=2801337 RepID=A0ABS1LAT2_9ACTN|nr:hypothetical protein [Nocardioides baculatus]MBL0748800.1 hypothetical protein [Nocardioides baculatus]